MKYTIFILLLLLVGCQQNTAFPDRIKLTTEGFIACVSANQKIQTVKQEEAIKAAEVEAAIKAESDAKAQEEANLAAKKAEEAAKKLADEQAKIVKTPKKYLRLFSAEAGCGPCIHQDQILLGSDWIMVNGTEKDNQDKIPYHGIKETIPHLNTPSGLWTQYKAKSVPFWQLVEDGKVVKTYHGVLNLQQLREFYLNTKTGEKHNNEDCTCENCKCGSGCKCE